MLTCPTCGKSYVIGDCPHCAAPNAGSVPPPPPNSVSPPVIQQKIESAAGVAKRRAFPVIVLGWVIGVVVCYVVAGVMGIAQIERTYPDGTILLQGGLSTTTTTGLLIASLIMGTLLSFGWSLVCAIAAAIAWVVKGQPTTAHA